MTLRLFGFEITRAPAISKAMSPVSTRGGWWPTALEWYPGAWQQNVEVPLSDALSYWAVFRCIAIISSDIGKMRLKLVQQDDDGIWNEFESAAFSPVIRKPNAYQTRIRFFANWMESKLTQGNTYVLKERDERNVVTALHILDPTRVTPLISDSKAVFYELQDDTLAGVETSRGSNLVVPSSEIIHDRWNTLYHPLVGLSPIHANGLAALGGLRAQSNNARFFGNGGRPGGILKVPASIPDEDLQRMKSYWENNYTGANAGRIAIISGEYEYTQLAMSAEDAQLIQFLGWTDKVIAGAFGVPAYMINADAAPSSDNVEALNQRYYSQCLQIHIEDIEACLDFGLGLADPDGLSRPDGNVYGVEFDLNDLLRMDSQRQVSSAVEGLKGIFTPNEARKKFDLKPMTGGDAVYLQQQNYSIEALNRRDSQENPIMPVPANQPNIAAANDGEDDDVQAAAQIAAWELKSQLASLAA